MELPWSWGWFWRVDMGWEPGWVWPCEGTRTIGVTMGPHWTIGVAGRAWLVDWPGSEVVQQTLRLWLNTTIILLTCLPLLRLTWLPSRVPSSDRSLSTTYSNLASEGTPTTLRRGTSPTPEHQTCSLLTLFPLSILLWTYFLSQILMPRLEVDMSASTMMPGIMMVGSTPHDWPVVRPGSQG